MAVASTANVFVDVYYKYPLGMPIILPLMILKENTNIYVKILLKGVLFHERYEFESLNYLIHLNQLIL